VRVAARVAVRVAVREAVREAAREVAREAARVMMGWNEFDRFRRTASDSRLAFMAMPYNVDLLDSVYSTHIKPAIDQCGFEIRRLDDKPKAGMIDDRMRVEIRRSRFLLAELTKQNKGVYWEAGFAEGLGIPVIYLCNARDFKRIHFDTSHLTTVKWHSNNLEQLSVDLKNVIRATLPGIAVMEDPDI